MQIGRYGRKCGKKLMMEGVILLFSAITAIILMARQTHPNSIEVYLPARTETILILDPGHGGLDGGATTADGVRESALNLAISERTRLLASLLGVPVLMTRSSEDLSYPDEAASIHEKKVWDQKRRVDLINRVPNAVLLSIHQNNYPDPRPCGTQVLYAASSGSRELGELIHALLIQSLCPDNRRVAAPISESIYLMRQVRCPAALVECGFLSNPTEASALQSEPYQTSLATVLIAAVVLFIE